MHVMVYWYKNKRHEHIAVEHVVAAWAPFLLDASNANERNSDITGKPTLFQVRMFRLYKCR